MPRKPLVLTDQFPYHITNRSNNKEFFYLPLEDLWSIFLECLNFLNTEFNVEVHAFVLMHNHYHLIATTPDCNLSSAMTYLHREVAKRANKKVQRINHFFGARYKWTVITNETYYWNAVKYVFRNPVAAGVCEKVDDYRFSSINNNSNLWQMTDFFNDPTKKIVLDKDWLNHCFDEFETEAIKKALTRREFKITRSKNGKKVELNSLNGAVHARKELGTK